ncbi:thioesterase [Amorphoplanes auranticolor]|uniref:Thioesterase n=1 Tax=Actinoplanes auranticolor TaxID=47988 RepID=A0A919VV51_9ACTN|nr:thioesterase [Actinoplanes auranticolor]
MRVFVPKPAAAVRLVCFPHAGGAASSFHDLAHAAPPSIEVTAVQYPGRQDRFGEPMAGSIALLAAEIGAALHNGDARPTAVFGHSMGALAAFEVARLWNATSARPLVAFVASGCNAPSRAQPTGLSFSDQEIRDYVRRLGGSGAAAFGREEVFRFALPVLRHDLRLNDGYTYHPGPPLTSPVLAVVGDRDPVVGLPEMRAWRLHTTGAFDTAVLPGDHFYLENQTARLLTLLTGAVAGGEAVRA